MGRCMCRGGYLRGADKVNGVNGGNVHVRQACCWKQKAPLPSLPFLSWHSRRSCRDSGSLTSTCSLLHIGATHFSPSLSLHLTFGELLRDGCMN